jgi:hypothetical protein
MTAVMMILAYDPFLDPLPIWVRPWIWPLLLLPLSAAVAVVYKSIRCRSMSTVARESFTLFVTIIAGMVLAAAALSGLAKFME